MQEKQQLNHWLKLPDNTKKTIFNEVGRIMGLPAFAIEKDWWVVTTLNIIFSMPVAKHLVFKGGTSLSKGWNLIKRFSEDIDLAIDRSYFGFDSSINRQGLKKLRRDSYAFLESDFTPQLQNQFNELGFSEIMVKPQAVQNHDQDPLIIEIYYPKLTETDAYLKPGVLVEIGARSLREPFTNRSFQSFVGEKYIGREFADNQISVPIVNPERTFLEKVFLLHEEFQKPSDKIRVDRLSRHLYDIDALTKSGFASLALADMALYNTIVEHRKMFTAISGIDYGLHQPEHIKFLPPPELTPLWERDFNAMRANMIYDDEAPTYEALIENLQALQSLINSIK